MSCIEQGGLRLFGITRRLSPKGQEGQVEKTQLLQIAKDTADKLFKEKRGMDNFCFVYADGTVSPLQTSQPCFAGVAQLTPNGRDYYSASRKANPIAYFVFVQDYSYRTIKPTIQNLHYLGWLMNKSAYAPLFITKKPSDLWKTACILDADATPQKVISAAIAVRYVYEKPTLVKTWVKFSYYIPKSLAYMLLHLTRWTDGVEEFQWSTNDAGHMALRGPYLRAKHVKNFMEGKLPQIGDKMSDGYRSYYGLDDCLVSRDDPREAIKVPKADRVREYPSSFGGSFKEEYYSISNLRKFAQEFADMNGIALA